MCRSKDLCKQSIYSQEAHGMKRNRHSTTIESMVKQIVDHLVVDHLVVDHLVVDHLVALANNPYMA